MAKFGFSRNKQGGQPAAATPAPPVSPSNAATIAPGKSAVASPPDAKPPPAIARPAPAMPQTSASPVTSRPQARVEGKPAAGPSQQAIAEAAYFLWLKRGGSESANWLEAERTLRQSRAIV